MATLGRRPVPAFGLKREDYERINATIPTIVAHMPVREIRRTFASGANECDGRLVGTTPLYASMSQIEIDRGSFLSDIDLREAMM